MSDPNAERAQIVAFMESILPVGTIIHAYERENLIDYDVARDGQMLHGYNVTNADADGRNPEMRRPLDTGSYTVDRMWTIRGFYSRNDVDSELVFRAELNALMDELTPQRSLGHTVLSTRMPILERFMPVEGDGYKFHYAEVVFATRSEASYIPQ